MTLVETKTEPVLDVSKVQGQFNDVAWEFKSLGEISTRNLEGRVDLKPARYQVLPPEVPS